LWNISSECERVKDGDEECEREWSSKSLRALNLAKGSETMKEFKYQHKEKVYRLEIV